MNFEWDPEKDRTNLINHGLSFSEAKDVFLSQSECLEFFDGLHSIDEDRFISIGQITKRIVVVVWTEREDDVIRMISARMASKDERNRYLRYLEQQL